MFGYEEQKLKELKGIYTAKEICQQPDTWEKTIAQIADIRDELDRFIGNVTSLDDFEVILTGAGSSEYAGNALCPGIAGCLDGHVRSVGTTDIVASPEIYLPEERPVLMVSFARSGNSPESVGAVKAADAVCKNAKHLVITCNENGALALEAKDREDMFAIVLAPETHDKSFAMTSSFSNMYLAAYLAFAGETTEWKEVIGNVRDLLDDGYLDAEALLKKKHPARIIYLGSDVLKGIAQEAALKVLELTAGEIVAVHDTPMGFRHGPKSIVNDDTLSIVFISDDPGTRRYELDLLAELYRDKKGSSVMAVVNTGAGDVEDISDLALCLGRGKKLDNRYLALEYLAAAQYIAFVSSLRLGITPDDPCPTGEVNRVVKGVTIYPVMR